MKKLLLEKIFKIDESLKILLGFNKFSNFSPSLCIEKTNDNRKNQKLYLNQKQWIDLIKNKVEIDSVLLQTTQEKSFDIKVCCIGKRYDVVIHKIEMLDPFIEINNEKKSVLRLSTRDWNNFLTHAQYIDTFFFWSPIMGKSLHTFYKNKYIPLCIKKNVCLPEINMLKKIIPKKDVDLYMMFCLELQKYYQMGAQRSMNNIKQSKLASRTKCELKKYYHLNAQRCIKNIKPVNLASSTKRDGE